MMMFARLKLQPLVPIQWLLALNITITVLAAIQAWALSPVMTGFSILAALAAATALFLMHSAPAQAVRKASDAGKDQPSPLKAANSAFTPKTDEMTEIAGLLSTIKPSMSNEAQALEKASLRRLEEALRRLANGDTSSLLHAEFPDHLDGLRFQFNRLASTLQVNLLPTGRAAVDLREGAYSIQSNLALLSARMEKLQEGSRAVSDATTLTRTALRTSEADMRIVRRVFDENNARAKRTSKLVADLNTHHNAAQASRLQLEALSRRMADFAVAAEQFVSSPEVHFDAIRRSHASECVDIARTLMQTCHEMASSLEAGSRDLAYLKQDQNYLADSLTEQAEPAERLTRAIEQELQRITVAQTVAREIAAVITRLPSMTDGVSNQMMKVMSDTTTIETRLSLFKARTVDRVSEEKPRTSPHLRCVT